MICCQLFFDFFLATDTRLFYLTDTTYNLAVTGVVIGGLLSLRLGAERDVFLVVCAMYAIQIAYGNVSLYLGTYYSTSVRAGSAPKRVGP